MVGKKRQNEDEVSKIKRRISNAFIPGFSGIYILFTSKTIGTAPLCTHQLPSAITEGKHENGCFFSILNSLQKSIHGRYAIFFPQLPLRLTSSAVFFFFFLNRVKYREINYPTTETSGGLLTISPPTVSGLWRVKAKALKSLCSLCKLSPLLHHSLIGVVNCFFNSLTWT